MKITGNRPPEETQPFIEEAYALIATLPPEIPAILEVSDTQADSPATVTRLAREVFSHAARLSEL